MEKIIDNLSQIMTAIDTLELRGYSQCKTYTNIIEVLNTAINDLISNEKESKKNV